MKITEPEVTQLALRIATAVKAEHLRRLPGMDAVAVALNSKPTDEEHMRVKSLLRLIEQAGYEIHKA